MERRIASYTLLEPIGHGGMAVVYRARHEALDRIVAIKILSENLAASTEFMERFRREARTAANLRHPNVITVFDFGQDERSVPYLVLEYIEGPTLADVMDRGLEDSRVANLLDQLASGLDYAHSRGVIHRDMKPGNVLMTDDGRAVLADFGLAWLLEGAHLTLSGGVIGTPEYMAPEQASGDPIDHRADVYSLGVVLYEMLVGERPFVAETPIGVLLKHLQDPAPSVLVARPDLPEAVGEVIARALAKDPNARFATAGELATAFRAAFFGQRTEDRALTADKPVPAAPAPRPEGEPVSLDPTPASEGESAQREWIDCPECRTPLPYGAGICPSCGYMVPLDKLPRATPSRSKIERRELVLNLLSRSIRWNPDGLRLARLLASEALADATVDGWQPASIGVPYQLVEGKTISGSIVECAVLKLERVA